ncbi:FecR domain-containing protein [Rhizobium sp. TH135]|uniref:FecR domain-containing protein n=1 Tax=Rhizobium sp. TH135 TaxID=2067451 RepID=UPI001558D485|nr:FecR domain-containing protein [Rhizobium sp. TH135]
MKTNTRHALLCTSAALLMLAGAPAQAETDVAGVTAAVNPRATAFDASGKPRLISLGDAVIRNHRIETSGEGLVQILLADGTSFTVGPNSSVVIDSFVYDPEKNTASLAATMTKGALRFIGGKASKASGNVKIDTPIGTAGIRGAVVDINLNGQTPDGQPLPPHMTLVYGKEVQLTGNGSPQRLFKQGFSIVAGDGQPRVQRTPPQWVSGLQQTLAGRPGQGGGTSNTPTDQTVASSTVSQSNSAQLPSENTIPVPQPRPIVTTPVEEVAGESQRDVGPRPDVPVDPVDPEPEPEEPWDGSAQAVTIIDNDGDIERDTISGNLTTDGDGRLTGTFGQLGQVSLEKPATSDTLTSEAVNGTIGSLGSVSGTAYTGSGEFIAYFLEADGGEAVYIVGGKAADASAVFSSGEVFRYSVQRDPLNGGTSIGGVTVPFTGSFQSGESTPVRASASDLYVAGVSGDDAVARLLQGSLSISGDGSTQRSRIQVMAGSFKDNDGAYEMTGRVSGSYQSSDPDTNSGPSKYVATLGSGSGDHIFGADGEYLVLATGGIDDFGAQEDIYDGVQVASRNSAATAGTRSFDGQLNGFSSGVANTTDGDSVVFNGTTEFTFDKDAGTFNGSIIDTSSNSNYFADFLDNPGYEQSYLTDQLIAGVDSWGEAYMVSSAVVAAKIFDDNSSAEICNSCDFMTWGWWGKQSGPESGYSVHLGNWIVGKQVEIIPSSVTGTATYSGHAVGTVVNDGSQYIATGDLSATMDFGARRGTIEISDFDGKATFGAEVSFESGANAVSTLTSTSMIGIATSVTGAFASNGTDPVKGIMGNFTATDGTWSSTGIFAGSTADIPQ